MSVTYELSPTHRDNIRVVELHFAVLKEVVTVSTWSGIPKGDGTSFGNTYGHDTTFCLLDAFHDEDTARTAGLSTYTRFPPSRISRPCLSSVSPSIAKQGDILILYVQ
jgi:hypothetical protein